MPLITNEYIQAFDAGYKRPNGLAGLNLASTINFKSGVRGIDDRFSKWDRTALSLDIRATTSVPTEQQYNNITVTTQTWYGQHIAYWQDQPRIIVSQADIIGQDLRAAAERRKDQIVYDALLNGYNLSTALDFHTVGLSTAVLAQVNDVLNKAGVQGSDRHVIVPARGLMDLAQDPQWISWLNNPARPLADKNTYDYTNTIVWMNGLTIHFVPENVPEGGLADADATLGGNLGYMCFAYQKMGVCGFQNKETMTRVEDSSLYRGIAHTVQMDAGAAVLDQDSVVGFSLSK